MAITHYIRNCEYTVGGLKDYIYLIPKDTVEVYIKASRTIVKFKNPNSTIYKINSALNVYKQQEDYDGRFDFTSTLEVTTNETYEEPFFYGLRTLRENQFYIVIEDKKGLQYLINPELHTKLTYEYTFTDEDDAQNSVILTYTNVSNHPLLLMDESNDNIVETDVLLNSNCPYNIGHSVTLRMAAFDDLSIADDGCKVTRIYVNEYDMLKRVDFMPQSFSFVEEYDGTQFKDTLSFSIPLDNNQFFWSYDLLEFSDNLYKALIHTTNNNYIVAGNENGLFPSYSIETSEDDSNPNLVTFKFTQLSQYPSLYTNDTTMYKWIDDGELCFGFNKYQMLKQQYSTDYGVNWEDSDPVEKKKGVILEENSTDCGYKILYQWIDTEDYNCDISIIYERWINVDGFICEDGDKYRKTQKQITYDSGATWNNTTEYGRGALMESCSNECKYVVTRWVDDGYGYLDVDDQYTYTSTEITGTACSGTVKINIVANYTHYSSDGKTYYIAQNDDTYTVNEVDSCECGYYYWSGTTQDIYKCGSELGDGYDKTTKYQATYSYKYCKGRRINPEEEPTITWNAVETESCDCGYYYVSGTTQDVYKCGWEIGSDYVATTKYQQVLGYKYCKGERVDPEETPSVQWSPVEEKCYECGYKSAHYVFDSENVCGNALPNNTTIVDNVDTSKEEDYNG